MCCPRSSFLRYAMTLHKICNTIAYVNQAAVLKQSKIMAEKRRTQAERRAETYKQVLDSATRLFGERGYANTSLEDISADCGVTTRPIYHYFGNKKQLFAAVNETMEQRILDAMSESSGSTPKDYMKLRLQTFLLLCDDPAFRQIVLIDSPNILGRERWADTPVTVRVREQFAQAGGLSEQEKFRSELVARMLIGAFAEAALMIAESDDIEMAKTQTNEMMQRVIDGIPE